MKAIILAGGRGTRLRPLTLHRPKPIVPLLGKPFLEYPIRWLEAFGIRDIALCLHYQADQVQEVLGDGGRFGVRLTYFYEDTPLGTGGALANCRDFWGDERVIVLNGDILVRFDLYGMVDMHIARRAVATIALAKVSDPTAYGLVLVKADGKVERFLEKPGWDQASGRHINAGVYILEPAVCREIDTGREVSIEREVFPGLLSRGYPVYSYREPFYWLDIGTPEKYLQAHFDLLDHRVHFGFQGNEPARNSWVDPCADVDPSVQLIAPVFIDAGARIGAGSTIGPHAVIGAQSAIGMETEIRQSVILEQSRIGLGSNITRCLLDRKTVLEAGVHVNGMLFAGGSIIEEGTRTIHPGSVSGS